ncbi:MAG TPA: hypothetical protein VLJ58_14015 [Ramlibacter sp.]|nr:hypothetical protein [Ramlibacter sp.]
MSLLVGPYNLVQPQCCDRANIFVHGIPWIPAIEERIALLLYTRKREGTPKRKRVVEHDRHVRYSYGDANRLLCTRESSFQFFERHAVPALRNTRLDAQDRNIDGRKPDKEQHDEIAVGLQVLDDVDLGFRRTVGECTPMGKNRLECLLPLAPALGEKPGPVAVSRARCVKCSVDHAPHRAVTLRIFPNNGGRISWI